MLRSGVDRAMLERHLAMTERHVAQGLGHIEKQHRIVAGLEAKGLPTAMARSVLALLIKTQLAHQNHRERVLAQLGTGP